MRDPAEMEKDIELLVRDVKQLRKQRADLLCRLSECEERSKSAASDSFSACSCLSFDSNADRPFSAWLRISSSSRWAPARSDRRAVTEAFAFRLVPFDLPAPVCNCSNCP